MISRVDGAYHGFVSHFLVVFDTTELILLRQCGSGEFNLHAHVIHSSHGEPTLNDPSLSWVPRCGSDLFLSSLLSSVELSLLV